jgi:hypothetical protein
MDLVSVLTSLPVNSRLSKLAKFLTSAIQSQVRTPLGRVVD